MLNEMVSMLEGYGDRFTGNHVEEIAQEWLDYGFTPELADIWCEIGVWNPGVAAEFEAAGLTPVQVKAAADRLVKEEQAEWDDEDWGRSRYTAGDPIYAVCNADVDVAVIIDEAIGR